MILLTEQKLQYYNHRENYYKLRAKNALSKKSSGLGFFIFAYAFLLQVSAVLIELILVVICGLNNDILNTTSVPSLLTQIFSSVFAAFIPGLFYFIFSNTDISETISVRYVRQKVLWPLVFIGMAIAMVANVASDIVQDNFSLFGLNNNIDFSNSTNTPAETILSIISTAVVPAFSEEFAFRGIVMGTLRKYGDTFAIIASAVLFGAMHGNITQIPFAFILGLVFAYIDCKTNSIVPSIIIHFINNFYAVISDIVNTSGVLDERIFIMASNILFSLLCLLGILGFVYLIKKDKNFFNISDNNDVKNNDIALLTLKEKNLSFFINPGIILSLSIFLIESIMFLGIINV